MNEGDFGYTLTRAKMLEAIDNAIELYINDEQIYQNMLASRKINKESLLKSRERDNLIDLIIYNTSFVKESYLKPHELEFKHQYYRDYFAAKHILNAIEAVEIGSKNICKEDTDDYMDKYKISKIWFNGLNSYPNDNNSYRLLGEISRDYKNIACEDFDYKLTLLDNFIWLAPRFDISFAARNIIRTMTILRNKVICGVDLCGMSTPSLLPTYAKFSMNGEKILSKSRYNLYYYKREDSILEEDFFIRTAENLISVEVKATNGRSKSLRTLINSERYHDIKYGIKFTGRNIGYSDDIYIFPYFCAFLLKKYLNKT